jgi:hypothetical protein
MAILVDTNIFLRLLQPHACIAGYLSGHGIFYAIGKRCSMSHRRISLNYGLPPRLTPDDRIACGFMRISLFPAVLPDFGNSNAFKRIRNRDSG